MKHPDWLKLSPRVVFGLVAVIVVGGLVGVRFLFFKVEGNPWQLPLQARDWTGFGESYDNNVSEVTEKGTETDGKTAKNIDKTTTTKTRLQPAKTLWDWMSLLLAPATLAGLGFLFQSSQERAKQAQEKADKERNADQQREAALQAYFDYLSDLLVDKQLKRVVLKQNIQDEEKINPAAVGVVKAKTLALFRLFDHADPVDMPRKASVLAFLHDSGLLKPLSLDLSGSHWAKAKLVGVNLNGAYLRGADLRSADLSGADLRSADLRGADLTGAVLTGAILESADLKGADLIFSTLTGADLSNANLLGADLLGADLSNANLLGANLLGANLSDARLSDANLNGAILLGVDLNTTKALTQKQLEGDQPPFLCHVKVPAGFTVNPQRDCEKLPEVLLNRYPKQFRSLEEAKSQVDKFAKS